MAHPDKSKIEAEAMKIIWLLNPYIYKDIKENIKIQLEGDGEEPYIVNFTVQGLIGFILGALHQLEHHQEKIDFKE